MQKTSLSDAEKGVLLYLAGECYDSNGYMKKHMGVSHSTTITQVSLATGTVQKLGAPIWAWNMAGDRPSNPYRTPKDKAREAISSLIEKGDIFAYKSAAGTRLLPTAEGVDMMIEAKLAQAKPEIKRYRDFLATEDRSKLTPQPAGEVGTAPVSGSDPAVRFSMVEHILKQQLGDSDQTKTILAALQESLEKGRHR